jgi:hypothetical protein
MLALYEAFREQAACFVVYIAEAHAVDGWQVRANQEAGICIRQHTTLAERLAAARRCAAELRLTIPTLVDGMDDAACVAYAAWPDRIYVVGTDGRVAYKGAPGPRGFRVGEAAAALTRILGAAGTSLADGSNEAPGRRRLAPPLTLRARWGVGPQAVTELEDVVEAWQAGEGRLRLRTLFGEERVVAGYVGGITLAERQLLLVARPGEGALPPLRRQAKAIAGAGGDGDTCPI